MFKSASERQSFTQRVASHSTKGHANGRVDILPPEARELEISYQDTKRQFEAVSAQIPAIEAELAEVRASLKKTQKYQTFEYLTGRLAVLEESLQTFRTLKGTYRELARAAGIQAYAECFYRIARLRLPNEVRKELEMEAERLIGRPPHEVKKSPHIDRDRYKARREFEKLQAQATASFGG